MEEELVAEHISDEQRAAWEEEQRTMAQQEDLPRSEYYAFVDLHSRHENCSDTAPPDARFFHRRLLLPDLEATLALAPHIDEQWDAVRRQIHHDATRQQQPQQNPPHTSKSVPALPELRYVGGVDISFVPHTNDGVACLAVLRYPSMECVATYMHRCTLQVPYVSGFLAFREVQPVRELFDAVRPALLAAEMMPQLLVVDGNGVQHPRRCGLATHLGVVLDIPTIGCSKKMLHVDGLTRGAVEAALERAGEPQTASASASASLPRIVPLLGASTPTQLYGYAVHGRQNSVKKCIFVSPGHGVGFAAATALVVSMLRHRIPEPIRAADLGSRAYIRDAVAAQDTSGTQDRPRGACGSGAG